MTNTAKIKYMTQDANKGEFTFYLVNNNDDTAIITVKSENTDFMIDLVTQILNMHKKKIEKIELELVVGYSKDKDVRALNEANNKADVSKFVMKANSINCGIDPIERKDDKSKVIATPHGITSNLIDALRFNLAIDALVSEMAKSMETDKQTINPLESNVNKSKHIISAISVNIESIDPFNGETKKEVMGICDISNTAKDCTAAIAEVVGKLEKTFNK